MTLRIQSFQFQKVGPEAHSEKISTSYLTTIMNRVQEWKNSFTEFQRIHFIEYLLCFVLVVLSSTLKPTKNLPTHSYEGYYHDFRISIQFNLFFGLYICTDLLLEWLYLSYSHPPHASPHTFSSPLLHHTVRRFCLFTMILPNILIYFQIIPLLTIPLIQYYQTLFCLEYITSQLHNTTPLEEVKNKFDLKIYIVNMISIVITFVYHLSFVQKDSFSTKISKVLQILFTIAMYGTYCIHYLYSYILSRSSLPTKNKITYVDSRKSLFLSYLIAQISMIVLPILYVIFYSKNYIFFPSTSHQLNLVEWFLTGIEMVLILIYILSLKNQLLLAEDQIKRSKTFTRSISHEIRTPLNTAFMALELLQDSMKYPNFQETEMDRLKNWLDTVDNVREACDIALGILNQLLTFDKLSSGMLQLERKLVPILQVLDMNTKLFKMQAIQAGITFTVDLTNEEKDFFNDILIYVDEHKLNQVIRNLLSNAMKFTPKSGCVSITIELDMVKPSNPVTRAQPSSYFEDEESLGNTIKGCFPCNKQRKGKSYSLKTTSVDTQSANNSNNRDSNPKSKSVVEGAKMIGTLKISVVDSGPGIEREDQSKLFQEYVQISPGALQKGQGSGLGLSISKSIISLHGGTIGVNSGGKNKGSCFYIELPAYKKRALNNDDSTPLLSKSLSLAFFSDSRKIAISPRLVSGNHPPANITKSITSKSRSNDSAPSENNHHDPSVKIESNSSQDTTHVLYEIDPALMRSSMNTVTTSIVVPSISERHLNSTSVSSKDSSHITPTRHRNLTEKTRLSPIRIGSHRLSKQLLVLIVDDSSANRRMLAKLLTRDGHTVLEADDGIAAVEIVRDSFLAASSEKSGRSAKHAASALDTMVEESWLENTKSTLTASNVQRASTFDNSELQKASNPAQSEALISTADSEQGKTEKVGYQGVQESNSASKESAEKKSSDDPPLKTAENEINRLSTISSDIMAHHSPANRQNPQSSIDSQDIERNSVNNNPSSRSNAAVGSQKLRSGHIDLILIDYFMKEMDGPQAAKIIRSLGYTGPMLGVTGLIDDGCDEFVASGVDLILRKPINMSSIWNALKSLKYV